MPANVIMKSFAIAVIFLGIIFLLFFVKGGDGEEVGPDGQIPTSWVEEFPKTDFTRHSAPLTEIISGGLARDIIPAISDPEFAALSEITDIAPTEPVIGLIIDGDARAYPLRVLTWHEIVNDTVGGVPVAVTFCPLCNAALVFDRRLEGRVLDFGVSGRLRHSDLIMYDRQTESWWQQFLGEGIVGEFTGKRLEILPARLESLATFRDRAPDGKVLVPSDPSLRAYGQTPYVKYDSDAQPMFYQGSMPEGIAPLARVVVVGKDAWSLEALKGAGRIEFEDLVLTWKAGQNSALDTKEISQGRDVGNVVAQRRQSDGTLGDVVYDVSFAFAFHAFHPDGKLHAGTQGP